MAEVNNMLHEKDYALLNSVYRNAEMGRDGLYFVLRHTDDTAFRKLVATQLLEYQTIIDAVEDKMQANGCQPEGNPRCAKMMVRMTACRKASEDNSPSALADMLIQGSSMGVTKMARQISHYRAQCEECVDLAEQLQKTEENNIHQLKQYL